MAGGRLRRSSLKRSRSFGGSGQEGVQMASRKRSSWSLSGADPLTRAGSKPARPQIDISLTTDADPEVRTLIAADEADGAAIRAIRTARRWSAAGGVARGRIDDPACSRRSRPELSGSSAGTASRATLEQADRGAAEATVRCRRTFWADSCPGRTLQRQVLSPRGLTLGGLTDARSRLLRDR